VRLVELRVHALPGVDEPFVVRGLASGTNLVVGPNASGKSRLVHALRSLVDPDASRGAGPHVEARFDDDGHSWRASRVGDAVRWERDGVAAAPPQVPPGHLLDGLFLSLEDLLRFGRADRGIADMLASELAGGVDLPRARRELASVGPRFGAPLRTELDLAREAVGTVRREHDALAAEEEQRAGWEERRRRAEASAASAPLANAALEVLAARRALASVEARARAFPAGLDALHDGVVEDVDALVGAVERAARELEEHDAERVAAEAQRAATGLHDGRPEAARVASWQAASEALAEAERTVREAERDSAERAGRLSALQRASGLESGGSAGPTPNELDELDAIAEQAQAARREVVETRRTLLEIDGVPEPTVDPDAARREVDLAATWLATPDEAGRWRRRARSFAYLAAVASAAAAAWRAPAPLDLTTEPGLLVVLAGVSTAVGVLLDVRTAGERRRARRARSEAGRALFGDAAEPGAWTRDAVRARLTEGASRAAEARHAHDAAAIRRSRRDRLGAELEEAEQRRERLERQLAARAERAGLGAELGTVPAGRSALERARRAAELRDAAGALHGARQAEVSASRHLERARTRIAAELHEAGLPELLRPPVDDVTLGAAILRVRLGELAGRVRRRDEADARRRAAERGRERAEAELDRARPRRDAVLAAATGRTPEQVARDPADAVSELRRRVERLPAWRALRDERVRLGGVLDHHLTTISDRPDLLALVEAGDEVGLRRELDEARAASEEVELATRTMAAIDERLARARRERDLDAARETERNARDALERAYEEVLNAEAASAVLDHLDRTYRSERLPAALRRAETWFARFTHHAFALAFDASADGPDRVHAVDRADGRRRRLDQLSSGTKAQLLLALRLAHALEAERGGPSLPLILDEALTTSDVGRFAAVAEALTTLTREEGRQVVYLSARRDDAALWSELADRSEGRIEAPTVLDLARIRGAPPASDSWASGAAASRTSASREPAWREPPAPDGLDAAGYASALGVAPIDPWRPERIHPLHLLHDRLDLVHRLTRLRIGTVGALASLLADEPQAVRLLGAGDRALVAARLEAARAWCERWRVGRGRAVGVAALTRSDVVSAAFLDRVARLADACSGDAEELLAALARGEIKRFREDAREALAGWLHEHGYLDPRPASTPAARVLAVEGALHAASRDGGDDAPSRVGTPHIGTSRVETEAAALATWLESGLPDGVANGSGEGESA